MNFSVILRHAVQRREHGMLECQCTKADSYHFIARKFFCYFFFSCKNLYISDFNKIGLNKFYATLIFNSLCQHIIPDI